MKKKLLISAHIGMSFRNIMTGPVFKKLKDNFDITVLSTLSNDPEIKAMAAREGFKLVSCEIEPERIKRMKNFYNLEYFMMWRKGSDTLKQFMERYQLKKGKLKYHLWNLFALLASLMPKKIIQLFATCFYHSDTLGSIGDFDAVFILTHDLIIDRSLLHTYNKKGVPVILLVHSWDNIASRAYLNVKPNRILVWNDEMKIQANRFMDIKPEYISVVGVPHFELYRITITKSKERFKEHYGIAGENFIITYICNSIFGVPDEPEFIEMLLTSLDKLNIKYTLLLRTLPEQRSEYYVNKYKNDSRVRLHLPSGFFAASIQQINDNGNSINDFVELLKYSDIIINYFSTVSIEACIFDTPALIPMFNVSLSENNWNTAKKWAMSNHFSPLIKNNLVFTANSFDSIIEQVKGIIFKDIDVLKQTKSLAKYSNADAHCSENIITAIQSVLGDK